MASFSNSSTNQGIVEQTRSFMRVDATQWPTPKIAASSNNWLDFVAGYMIGRDRRFQWHDTNHTKLPQGTSDLTINVTDYSFLTDDEGNTIVTLLGISLIDAAGAETPLTLADRGDVNYDIVSYGKNSGTPTRYDQIADNVVRLDFKPSATISGGLKFYFQTTPSYFVAADTTKAPGVSPLLHRGFVIASAYDGALTLGLENRNTLAVELEVEKRKVVEYFRNRNRNQVSRMVASNESNR